METWLIDDANRGLCLWVNDCQKAVDEAVNYVRLVEKVNVNICLTFRSPFDGHLSNIISRALSPTFEPGFRLAFAPALSHDWWCQKEQARRQKSNKTKIKYPLKNKSSQAPQLMRKIPKTKKNKHKIKWKTTFDD